MNTQSYDEWLEELNMLLPDEVREEFEGSQVEEEWARIKFDSGWNPHDAHLELLGMWEQ